MKCKPYSKITVEIRTQLKTVKITSNIFAVWCNLFYLGIPRKKIKELLRKVPSKIYGSYCIMEKNKNIFWLVNNSEYHHREMGLLCPSKQMSGQDTRLKSEDSASYTERHLS